MNNKTKNNLKYGLGGIAFLIVCFAIFILPEIIKSNKTFSALYKDGLITDAIVVESFINRTRNGYDYMVVCKYFADGLVYTTQYRAVTKTDYLIGDTLKIVYSKSNPNIYRIIDPYGSNDIELMDSVMIRLAEKDIQINLQQ
ncbi:MAG: hypothetical protein LBS69_05375 [Prevotellaceae bacterium]|jgi:hypothetical protein|nr:hypothetical protein [Prevotellaceae bacterium]